MSSGRICAVAVGLWCVAVGVANEPTPIAVGRKAPDWKDLPGIDGKNWSLADLARYKVVVIAFTCNSCPYSVAYEDRFIDFAKRYEPKGVGFIAINVNLEESDRLPKMKERGREKGFPFPYLHDASQQSGRAYGATVTPHLFALDAKRTVAYVGAFDDAKRPEKVGKQFVRDAVDALLAGKTPAVPSTRATGCRIPYE
jgi:thiol-disulfide isomerase/thioredoxin